MILDGIAGAVAANTVIKTAVAMSGLTSIVTWLVWAIFIYVIGVKLFPDKKTKVPFKKVLTAVGFAHAPGLLRFFAGNTKHDDTNNISYTILDFCRTNYLYKANIKFKI
jgi:hypothetical protein